MQSAIYPELPQNEALTMSLAKTIGLEVPKHGLVRGIGHQFTYYIQRFDRLSKHRRLQVEYFAQLSGAQRDTKYESSMEKVVDIVKKYCTYPKVELAKLFKLTIFNFLIGNEDMHLKNFSLITKDGKVMLAPVYDLLNSSIVLNAKVEVALPIKGKRNSISRKLLCEYFGKDRMELNDKSINHILSMIEAKLSLWQTLIQESELSEKMKRAYIALLKERANRFGWSIQ